MGVEHFLTSHDSPDCTSLWLSVSDLRPFEDVLIVTAVCCHTEE